MLLGSNFSSKNGPDYQYLSHFNSDHHFSQVPCYQFALLNFAPGRVPPRVPPGVFQKSYYFIIFFYQNFPTSLKTPLPRFYSHFFRLLFFISRSTYTTTPTLFRKLVEYVFDWFPRRLTANDFNHLIFFYLKNWKNAAQARKLKFKTTYFQLLIYLYFIIILIFLQLSMMIISFIPKVHRSKKLKTRLDKNYTFFNDFKIACYSSNKKSLSLADILQNWPCAIYNFFYLFNFCIKKFLNTSLLFI